ncbi:hypothetical protein GCK72_021489 [Caenorhabditis remanei]|uniref:Uncharacterized protein n=1 Tax=Caenorhabditis remanei TaxID=31234 RepID=A0A6A5GJL6_CAERE|nr:hypothetical protein GCK72_021489 [Caenorhabditis remanei]KAF1754924.1 hypothetical protein GCK72_021489 [Caenorhabditis remanei]
MIIYPIKKSFEIGDWIAGVIACYDLAIFIILVSLGIDIYSRVDGLSKSELDSCVYTMLYLLIHIIIVMILIVVLTILLPQRHFKIGYYFTIAQSFLLVFWIIQFNKIFIYGSKVDQIRQQFIFTIFAQIVAIPLLFGTTYICSQAFLQFSKLRPEYDGDDQYEVIYGGEVSFRAQFLTIPLLIINTYISAQVYLMTSKLRPEYDGDDLYEVIEGSEGSSTKKNDV